MIRRTLGAAALAIWLVSAALAQGRPDPNAEAVEAFNAGRIDEAESLWRRLAEQDQKSFVPWYNLACARSVRGDGAGAAEHMLTAVERGFADLGRLKTDENLRVFRATETYTKLVEAWPAFLDRRIDTQLEAARLEYGPRYSYIKDEKHRLAFVSAFDTVTSRQAREHVHEVAEWALTNLFPELRRPDPDHPEPWILVILPTREHFDAWARQTYGDLPASATSQLGGAYSHEHRKLVTIDLGSTLRHEFLHVLHWRSSDRLGQQHAIWVQEGLAALVEDMDQTPRGAYEPAVSWRTNSVKRLAEQNKLPGVAEFTSMPRERFSGSRPLANYAVARSIFMFLLERGELDDFYAAYAAGHEADPTGLDALLTASGMTAPEFDEAMRRWAVGLDEVYEQNRAPSLGIGALLELDQGDGPVVRRILDRAAKDAGLRVGDVITGLNGRPVRDLNEFYRVLTPLNVGERVELTYRRRLEHKQSTVLLVNAR
jgi:hypothetical protein